MSSKKLKQENDEAFEDSSDFSFYAQDWLMENNMQKQQVMKQAKKRQQTQMKKQKTSLKKEIAKKTTETNQRFPFQAAFMLEYRKNRDLSQEALGFHLGGFGDAQTARQSISEIERGNRGITPQMSLKFTKEEFTEFLEAYLKDQELEFLRKMDIYD